MIPKDFITAWRAYAPWQADAQVEQDLVISRAFVDIFNVHELAESLIFALVSIGIFRRPWTPYWKTLSQNFQGQRGRASNSKT